MGGVQSLDRGEIVAFNLGPPAIASTPVEKLLGDTGVINVLKVPKVRNENWERAKPAFKPQASVVVGRPGHRHECCTVPGPQGNGAG